MSLGIVKHRNSTVPPYNCNFSPYLAQIRADQSHTSLVEAVIFAGADTFGSEVQCEQQLSSSGIQIDWQCHLVLTGLPVRPENKLTNILYDFLITVKAAPHGCVIRTGQP